MEIKFKNMIDVETYNKLRETVGWNPLAPQQAQRGLEHSYCIVAEAEHKTAGMLRILSDNGYMAFIADVMVFPEYQGKGIGTALMEKAMDHIRTESRGLTVIINLMAVQGKESFYTKFGFIERPNSSDGAGMHQWINPFEKK